MAKIHSLCVYPVKSCKGVELTQAIATPTGLKYDREWMIYNKNTGQMVNQLSNPQMTLIECGLTDSCLTMTIAGKLFNIPFDTQGRELTINVMRTELTGVWQSVDGLESALDDFLQTDGAILIKFTGNRRINGRKQGVQGSLKYAETYPYTIADIADFNGLNNYFQHNGLPEITIARFRANIVLAGVVADVGSNNQQFVIETASGSITGEFCEPCKRCPMPDIDPLTGKQSNHQIQRSLKDMRRSNKDWFSTHSKLNIAGEVKISVGDTILLK